MLEFFRKYQRIFFIFVTVIIIVTFSLFGTYKTLGQIEKRKEIVVGHAVDGSKLTYSTIRQLSNLLGSETGPSSVVNKDLLETGIGDRLAAVFQEELQADWQSRLDRAKRYRFYIHPAAAEINSEAVWNHFAPGIGGAVRELQEIDKADSEFFSAWRKLYLQQCSCNPEMVRRAVYYQQNQYHVAVDQRIFHEDFSLFGLQTAHDWFGSNFLDAAAQFILNGAICAEEKGYRAEKAEAELDLIRRFAGKNQNLDIVLQSVGLSRSEAIDLWQRALVFLRYVHDVGESVLVDSLPYRQFSRFAGESAKLDVYSLPESLQMRSLDDFLDFEAYCRLACAPCETGSLPNELLSADIVEKQAPELVAAIYRVSTAEIDLDKVAARIPLREVDDWQLQPAHWAELEKKFPDLSVPAKNHLRILEALEPARRRAIDDWSRQEMIRERPKMVEEELAAAKAEIREIMLFADGVIDGLPVQDTAAFRSLLNRAFSGEPEAAGALKQYREGQIIRRIDGIEKIAEKSVLSFEAAKKKGRIPAGRFLEGEYLACREKRPALFQNEQGEWKSLFDAKEEVIRQIFRPLFIRIGEEEIQPLSFYVQNRFRPFMEETEKALAAGKTPVQSLWNIEKCERTVTRTASEEWIMKQPFVLSAGEWSDIYVPPNGEIVFFYVSEKTRNEGPVLEQMQLGKIMLSAEAKCKLADQLLSYAMKKQAIVIPLKSDRDQNDDL